MTDTANKYVFLSATKLQPGTVTRALRNILDFSKKISGERKDTDMRFYDLHFTDHGEIIPDAWDLESLRCVYLLMCTFKEIRHILLRVQLKENNSETMTSTTYDVKVIPRSVTFFSQGHKH